MNPLNLAAGQRRAEPIDRLREEARIMGQSRTIRHDDAERVTRDQAVVVIEKLKAWREQGGKYAAVARGINCNTSVLSQVIHQNYPGDWQSVILDVDRWLEDEEKRQAAPRPTEFVWTAVAEEIRSVAEAVVHLGTIGLIYDTFGSGIGKSITLQAIRADKPGSVLVSIDTANANPTGMLRSLCKAAGAEVGASSPRGVLFDALVRKLKGTDRLVMVDEAHKLCGKGQDEALHVLRDLHDAAGRRPEDDRGLPVLLCATNDLRAYVDGKKAKGREPMAQIASRIGVSRDLRERATGPAGGKGEPLYTADEIRAVFRKSAMRLAPDAVQLLATLANLPDEGALRTCKNLVVMATRLYQKTHDVLTADLLRSAGRMLASRRAFELLDARVAQAAAAPRAAKVG